MQPPAERLLPRLVPKHRPPRIGAERPAEERQLEQGLLPDPPSPLLGPRLVEAESGKGEEIHHGERSDDVGGGEQGLQRSHARGVARDGLPKG